MAVETISEFIKYRREVAARKCELPSEVEIRESTSWISDPESGISKTFLPHIISHAGQMLDAGEITNLFINGYNASIASGELPPFEARILMSLLTLYTKTIVGDKKVGDMVAMNINHAIELARSGK